MAKTAGQAKTYELTYLLPVSLTDSEATRLKDGIVTLVKKHKGSVVKTEDWGKRRLAYSIKHSGAHQTEATYTHLVLSFDSAQLPEFEKALFLQNELMRHLLVVATPTREAAPVVEATE